MAKTYGQWLKEAREAKGWTQQELANASFISRSHISHIEADIRDPSESDAKQLDRALGTGDVLVTFRPGREQGSVPGWFERGLDLERQATIIREFGLIFVPGILQTEAYADAVLRQAYPPLSEEQRHKDVRTRMDRAARLEDPMTPLVWALLEEGVLRRPVASPPVMAEQLHHIANLGEQGRIRVHVLPYGAGLPLPAMITIMRFEDQPPVVYTEAVRAGKLHDSPSVVQEIEDAYDLALSDALSLEQSLIRVRAAAEEYEQHD